MFELHTAATGRALASLGVGASLIFGGASVARDADIAGQIADGISARFDASSNIDTHISLPSLEAGAKVDADTQAQPVGDAAGSVAIEAVPATTSAPSIDIRAMLNGTAGGVAINVDERAPVAIEATTNASSSLQITSDAAASLGASTSAQTTAPVAITTEAQSGLGVTIGD